MMMVMMMMMLGMCCRRSGGCCSCCCRCMLQIQSGGQRLQLGTMMQGVGREAQQVVGIACCQAGQFSLLIQFIHIPGSSSGRGS